jgi:hypothetical protein
VVRRVWHFEGGGVDDEEGREVDIDIDADVECSKGREC